MSVWKNLLRRIAPGKTDEPRMEFESITDYLPDSLIVIDRRGIVTSVNRACCELLGYRREEITGQSASMFFVRHGNGDTGCSDEPHDRDKDERYLGKILDELVVSGFVNDLEVVFMTKDCRRIPMNFNGVVLRSAKEEITGVLGLARDMRQTKKNIQKLSTLKNISLLSLENIPVENALARMGELVKKFLAADRITFYVTENDKLRAAYASDISGEVVIDACKGVAGHVARSRKPYYTNDAPSDPHFYPLVDEASGYKTRRLLAVPVIESDKLFGVVEALNKKTDFTEEDVSDMEEIVNLAKFVIFDKIKDVKLARSEERYRELVESISDVIYTLDTDGKITYVSSAVKSLLGCPPSDLTGKHYSELIHPDDLAAAQKSLEDSLRGKEYPLECRVRTAKGEWRWVRTVGKIYHVDGKTAGVRAVLSDITERKNAEEDLKNRLIYEKMLADISAAAVVTDGDEEFINNTLALLGKTLEVSRVYIFEHREDTDTMDNTYEWCAAGVSRQKDTLQSVPAGAVPWWMSKMKKYQIINYSDINDIPSENEKNILKSQDIKSVLVFPIYVHSRYYGFIGFDDCSRHRHWAVRDIDILKTVAQIISWTYERRRMETDKMRLNMQMLQSAKMASVGDLAAGLAHEIGNPLQTVLGNADLILLENKVEEAEAIKQAALHARKIIENLMDFSRQQEMKFDEGDVNGVIEKTLSLYGKQLELSGIKIVKRLSKMPSVRLSAPHISQVFLNIITNARKAMPGGGTLEITTTLCPAASREGAPTCAVVSFKDTGTGMEPEVLKRVFEPFYTTKKDGTGLGMAVSYGIIKQHDGEITVHSDGPGKGTSVIVKLPFPDSAKNGRTTGLAGKERR